MSTGRGWLKIARIAWRYFQLGVGVNPTTGLHYANTEWHMFTGWNLAGYILAIINAEELGILPKEGDWGADYRINKTLRFLQNRPLTEDRLPYLIYDAETGGLPSGVEARPTNACDEGRLLIALNKLKQHKPDLAQVIDDIVSRVDYVKLALRVAANHFYDYYIAHGLTLSPCSRTMPAGFIGFRRSAGKPRENSRLGVRGPTPRIHTTYMSASFQRHPTRGPGSPTPKA